jgi:hypothetical protein
LLRPRVDSGQIPDPASDVRIKATTRLRSVEGTLKDQHGSAGLDLTRAVLTGGKSVEKTAREFGANSTREVLSWGWLFRQCLNVLCKALGLANSAKRPRRFRYDGDGSTPDAGDPSLHASAADLADPGVRRGRPNG